MRIVLVGASGNAGREIARLLTPGLSADDEVVLTGRNKDRLAATAAQSCGPATVRVEIVDVEDDASVRRLVAGAGLVIVTASVPQRIPALARIVAEAGADWYDTLLSSRTKLGALRELEPLLRSSGLCFVTDGGFHPGLPAAMVRWAAGRIDALETAVVYGGMRLDWRAETLADSTIAEMLTELTDFDMTTYVDGAWRELKWAQCPTVDFGPPIGRKSCVPMYLAEMESLPTDIPTLRRCGFFVGGFSPLMDYVALPVIMGLARVPALQRMTVALTRWSFGHLANDPPPHRLSIRLEASGLRGGSPPRPAWRSAVTTATS
jgi:saccharopine dehydrogenase-like NADP-dependent oxidoreductase